MRACEFSEGLPKPSTSQEGRPRRKTQHHSQNAPLTGRGARDRRARGTEAAQLRHSQPAAHMRDVRSESEKGKQKKNGQRAAMGAGHAPCRVLCRVCAVRRRRRPAALALAPLSESRQRHTTANNARGGRRAVRRMVREKERVPFFVVLKPKTQVRHAVRSLARSPSYFRL